MIVTALIIAIREGSVDECRQWCRRLVEEEGTHVHKEDKYGWGPIRYACMASYLDILEYLVSKEANIEDKDTLGWSCFMIACSSGHLDVAEFLLSRGASFHEMNKHGHTCYSYALRNNYIRVLYRLRKWPTTMAILVLQELTLIYIIDSESVIDLHQYLGRPDDCTKTDNEEDYIKFDHEAWSLRKL